MLDKIKKVFKKKPAEKKVKENFDNMIDVQSAVGSNTKQEVKTELKSETKSSLTFGK